MDKNTRLADEGKSQISVPPKIDLRVLGRKPYPKELFKKSIQSLVFSRIILNPTYAKEIVAVFEVVV